MAKNIIGNLEPKAIIKVRDLNGDWSKQLESGVVYSCIDSYGIIVIDDIAKSVEGTVAGLYGSGQLTVIDSNGKMDIETMDYVKDLSAGFLFLEVIMTRNVPMIRVTNCLECK
jgi:hypothetical protein